MSTLTYADNVVCIIKRHKNMKVFYSSTNGQRNGRASYFFRSVDAAEEKVAKQNIKAETMGIEARYQLTEADDATIGDKKTIRDI